MAWFKVDDKIAFGPKHLAAGNEAVGAWVRAGAWCCDHRTDGHFPTEVALAIAPERVWKRLVDAKAGREHGLVEVMDGGYQLHDFTDYNPAASQSDEAAAAKREAKSRAGRAGGRRSGEARRAKQTAKQNEAPASFASSKNEAGASFSGSEIEAKRSPDPDPDPDPRERSDLNPPRVPDDVHGRAEAPPESTRGVGESTEPERIGPDWLRARMREPIFGPVLAEEHLQDLAGRLVLGGVCPRAAARALSDFPATGPRRMRGNPRDPADLLDAIMGFAAAAKRRDAAERTRKDGPLNEPERAAEALWRALWAADHGGAEYAEAPNDREVIRNLVARAQGRAAKIGLDRIEPILRHVLAGYLRIDDRRLVEARYPLALLEARLPTIGEYVPPATTRKEPEPEPVRTMSAAEVRSAAAAARAGLRDALGPGAELAAVTPRPGGAHRAEQGGPDEPGYCMAPPEVGEHMRALGQTIGRPFAALGDAPSVPRRRTA